MDLLAACHAEMYSTSPAISVPQSRHYNDVIMGAMASQITSLTIVCSIGYSGADQRKHQSSASLAFVRGIHRSPVNSPHKGPVTRKCFHLMTLSWTISDQAKLSDDKCSTIQLVWSSLPTVCSRLDNILYVSKTSFSRNITLRWCIRRSDWMQTDKRSVVWLVQ